MSLVSTECQITNKDALTVRDGVNVYLSGSGFGCKGGVWHKTSVSDCLPLAAPIGLSPLLILTLCGPERVLVVSTEPLDDLWQNSGGRFWGRPHPGTIGCGGSTWCL